MAGKSIRLTTLSGLRQFTVVVAVLAFLTACPAWAAPVQRVVCSVSGAPYTCALTNPVQTGHLLVFEFHSSVAPTSVTDTLGSQWRVAVGPLSSDYILYAVAPVTGAEIVRESTSNAWAQGALFEYSGFSALDVTASRSFTAGTTQISSGSATTTVPGDLIIGWMSGSGWSAIQPGAGFTIEAVTAPEAFEDMVAQNAGAVAATFTEPSWSGAGAVLMATFKPSVSATVQSNPITVGLSGTLDWDSGFPIAGSVVISQILANGTKQRLASLPIGSDGTVTGTITFDASVQPLVLESDLLNSSSNLIESLTLNSSSSSPLSQTTTTILLLMKSLNAKVVLYQATAALKSIQVTPTLSFP